MPARHGRIAFRMYLRAPSMYGTGPALLLLLLLALLALPLLLLLRRAAVNPHFFFFLPYVLETRLRSNIPVKYNENGAP